MALPMPRCNSSSPRGQRSASGVFMHRRRLVQPCRMHQRASWQHHHDSRHALLACISCAVLAAAAAAAPAATKLQLAGTSPASGAALHATEAGGSGSRQSIVWPNEAVRRGTAQDLLAVLARRRLRDAIWEGQLQSAMLPLHGMPREPAAWRALCNATAGGDPRAPRRALGWREHRVPDVEGAASHRCQLTSERRCRRFASPALNRWLAALFEALPDATAAAGMPQVVLSRYDLFHAHIFVSHASGELGLLFHAREYPAANNDTFPYNLGYCQQGTPMAFDGPTMDLRNILYFQGRAAVLDVGPSSVLHTHLIMDGLQEVRTVQENDLGRRLLDVNYFHVLPGRRPRHRIFICP